jgi:glycosyltransferase involved in cell wall biosynthesis
MFCESTEHPDAIKLHKDNYKEWLKDKLNQHKAFFVISQSLKDYYNSIGVKKEKIYVINMFVDTNRFNNLKRTTNENYIAYCGAVSYDKDGADILIESFAKFYPSHKDYKLLIVGKGVEPSVIDRLKDLAKQLGIEQQVVFTGLVAPQEMPQLLFNARILALARPDSLQAQNGFPTKLGEYLATGNPVVVTRVGEIPLFIKHRENGFLADPNTNSFSEQLAWVADNYDQALQIGARGRELAYNDFSYYSQSKKALDIMNQ